MRKMFRYPLLLALVLSSLAVVSLGMALKSGSLYTTTQSGETEQSPITTVMLWLRDGGNLKSMLGKNQELAVNTDREMPQLIILKPGMAYEPAGEESSTSEEEDNVSEEVPETSAEPEPEIPESFDHTLFIGDSRTVGCFEYAPVEGADYFARTSMTVFNAMNDEPSDTMTGDLTLKEMLENNSYNQIFIMLGLNEIGYNRDSILSGYQSLLEQIQQLQPDASIVLCANLYVTKEKSESGTIYTNENIRALNSEIQKLAEEKNLRFMDPNGLFDDGNGNMRSDYSGDGVHIYAKYYESMRDWYQRQGD